jgi:polysaccharide export outer membrane protein
VRANKTGVYVFRMGDLRDQSDRPGPVFRLDLFQPVSIFVAQQFGLQAAGRDLCHQRARCTEYDKILTSIYRTFSIIGIARGTSPSRQRSDGLAKRA